MMTPEYLEQLADVADPDQLWRLDPFAQKELPEDKRNQLNMGVALRRHADHVRQLRGLVGTGRSLVITPMGINGQAVTSIDAPPQHRRLLDAREAAGLEEIARARLSESEGDRNVDHPV
jgi:hypothetical protein